MANVYGAGDYRYEIDLDWAKLPQGWDLHEVADVAVDAQDRVYVFNRGEHPMIVLDRDGAVLTSWGEGLFSRAHGLTIIEGVLYCADDGDHTVRVCTPDGQVLVTLGAPNEPAPYQSGEPFNRPTKVALGTDGALYVADGYGNARVQKYSAEGEYLSSWGRYGCQPGEFNLVHSICSDAQGRLYVADRENHRVQVFDPDGGYITQWNNLHRPCGLHIDGDLVYIGQLPPSLAVNADYPNLGARVSVHDLEGNLLSWVGADRPGDQEPDQFYAPHGLATDSHGDLYVGEVAHSFFGSYQDPPVAPRCLRKLVRV